MITKLVLLSIATIIVFAIGFIEANKKARKWFMITLISLFIVLWIWFCIYIFKYSIPYSLLVFVLTNFINPALGLFVGAKILNIQITKKCLMLDSGFIRFKNGVEINWSISDWALPLSITFSEHLLFIRILFISLIIQK